MVALTEIWRYTVPEPKGEVKSANMNLGGIQDRIQEVTEMRAHREKPEETAEVRPMTRRQKQGKECVKKTTKSET